MNEKTKKWERLLSATPEEFWDDVVAALENQYIHNDSLSDMGQSPMMKRVSIPLIVRMMNKLCGKVKSRFQYTAKVMRTNIKPWWCNLENRFHPRWDLKEEAQKLAELAEKLVAVIETELPKCKGEFLLLGITADDDGTIAIFYDVVPE